MQKSIKIVLALFVIVFVIMATPITYFRQTRQPRERALAALQSSDSVDVSDEEWVVFYPTESQPKLGLILYPGTFVDPGAYAEPSHAIAENGYLVVIPPVSLGMAALSFDIADEIQEAFPEIESWVIGGHSQGGAAASRFAFQNPDSVDGLLLWVGKPLGDDDLSQTDIPVMSIYGTLDHRRTPEVMAEVKQLYPPNTEYVAIDGGNHTFFGDYSEEDAEPATISHQEQNQIIVEHSLSFLADISSIDVEE